MPNGALRARLLERRQHRESSARTYATTLPVAPIHVSGAVVTGAGGRRYLDCLSGTTGSEADEVLSRIAAATKSAVRAAATKERAA